MLKFPLVQLKKRGYLPGNMYLFVHQGTFEGSEWFQIDSKGVWVPLDNFYP